MKKIWSLTLIILIFPFFLYAQEEIKEVSLQKAVDYAIEHNKELAITRKNIDLNRQKVKEAISQGLPQVNGSLDYSTNFGYKANFGGNSIQMKDQSNVEINVNQLIFSGEWILGIKTSKLAEKIANQQVTITELDVKENVFNTYYLILVTERTVNILRENLANMEQILQHTQNMYNAGTVEITDVDQIRITVSQLKNSILNLERNIEVSYNLLKIQMGLDAETTLVLTEELETFLNDQMYAFLMMQGFDISKNAEYQLLETQEDLAEKMVGMKKWAYSPSVAATYGYTYKLMKSDFDLSSNHGADITMSIPIFSGLARKAQLEQAKIELEQTQINKSLVEDQLGLSDEQYRFELRNAYENYMLQKDNIDVASRVLANYQRKYEFGVVSSLDLTQANNNYLQAETDYTNAALTLLQAKTNLERLYNSFPY
ncbi:MAG: TolC family protein [Odoribacter sp.]|nr:TolC family protein [Odoribacter sp.]